MKYLFLLSLLCVSCGISVIEETPITEAKTFETQLSSKVYEDFYQNVDEYTQLALEKLNECDIDDTSTLDPSTINIAVYDVGFSSKGGALYQAPDFIGIRDDLVRPMSFYAHELGRWVLFHQGHPQWDISSTGDESGWTVEPMQCVWNICESWSLCYVSEEELGYVPGWCDQAPE